jgi:4-hydroxyphenylpyruvate dioxygenase-like putative hemolysin
MRIIGYFILVLAIFLEGGLNNEKVWQARVKEVEAKLAIAEQQSKEENVKIVNKVVTKTQIIRTKGDDIVKYIDREIVKYDTKFAPGGQCEIPKEFIKAINDAAEAPK